MIDFFHLGSNDAATRKPPQRPTQPPPHYHCEQLLAGWEWVSQTARQWQRRHPAKQNEDATGRRNDEETKRRGDETTRRRNDGGRRGNKEEEAKQKKKGPKRHHLTSFGPSVSFFFPFSFHYFITNELFRYQTKLLTMTMMMMITKSIWSWKYTERTRQ